MSKRHKRVQAGVKPDKNVKTEKPNLSNLIYIDLVHYPQWTDTVKVGGFTNYLKDSKQALRHFFFILNQLFPDIEDYGMTIFSGQAKHCHKLNGNAETTAKKVINKLYNGKIVDSLSELWELSGKTEEIRIIGTFVTSSIHTFYPLFIDHHHLIYPDEKHNKLDYKNYSFAKDNIKSAK